MRFLLLPLLMLATTVGAIAAAAPAEDPEIAELLRVIEKSDAQFTQNSIQYTAPEAAEHMRRKLELAGSRVKSADDFIQDVGTETYGKPHTQRWGNGRVEPTGPWLRSQLHAIRQQQSR